MIVIKATPKFMQLAKKAMTGLALQELIDHLAFDPEIGVLIRETGGIRKLRWCTGKGNQGKSGGVRVLYYYEQSVKAVLLITLFKKSDKENIDANEKTQLRKILPALLRSHLDE